MGEDNNKKVEKIIKRDQKPDFEKRSWDDSFYTPDSIERDDYPIPDTPPKEDSPDD